MERKKVIYAILTVCLIFGTIVYAGTCYHRDLGDLGPDYSHDRGDDLGDRQVYFENGCVTMASEDIDDATQHCTRYGTK